MAGLPRRFRKCFRDLPGCLRRGVGKVRSTTQETLAAIKGGEAYLAAPLDRRDEVIDKVFGVGRPCHYPPIALSSVGGLLEATSRRSLSSLARALVALPGYQEQVEAELRELTALPPPPGEKVYEWRPARLSGKRLKTEREVDDALDAVGDDLKSRIRDGYTVVVK